MRSAQPPVEQVFQLMENSRSRILQDQWTQKPDLQAVQRRLGKDTCLLEFWAGPGQGAVLVITRSATALLGIPAVDVKGLRAASMDATRQDWRVLFRAAGEQVLGKVPALQQTDLRHIIVVPDGLLSLIPFELLSTAGDRRLLIERASVTYMPSAGVLLRPTSRERSWSPPWRQELLAFADPAADASGSGLFRAGQARGETWSRLPKAVEEVRYIASVLPGRPEVRVGADAAKKDLLAGVVRRVPLMHMATHATADYTAPERSRILFAPAEKENAADFLFLREIYGLDLKGVDLVVLSACDAETGKLVQGEGVEGFGKAFLTAGANTTVTTLWSVQDSATSQFMQQFYFALASGEGKADALRDAKLRFLRSGKYLAHPQFWAAFVMNGDGFAPIPRFLSWTELCFALTAMLLLAGAIVYGIRVRSSR